jgi:hypothetical protein
MIYLDIPYTQKHEGKPLGARWDPKMKLWYFPGDVLPEKLERFRPTICPKAPGETIVLDIPFCLREIAAKAGARWNPDTKTYLFEKGPGQALPAELEGFEPKQFSWEDKIQRRLNGTALEEVPAQKRIVLKAHQQAAVEEILTAYHNKYPGFLLADDVGLGKTFTAWAAILKILENAEQKAKILIVCPLGVVPGWRSSVQWIGTNRWIEELIILNYEGLGRLFEGKPRRGAKRVSRKELARRGIASEGFDIVVFDESHALKNLSSLRAKLSIKLYPSAKMIFWLSATAGQNPLELGYLAPILTKKTGLRALSAEDFERWCAENLPGVSKGKYGEWQWAGDKEEEQEVHRILFDPDTNGAKAGLRRRASDLVGWPEINRIVHWVELDREAWQLYKLAWKEFKKALEGAGGLTRQRAALAKNEAVIRLRQKSSLLKVRDSTELCLELLRNGRQVAISCEFLATMDAMAEALQKEEIAFARIDGRRTGSSEHRENERLRYQRGEVQVMLFSVTEGICLHQGELLNGGNNVPRCQIDHDLRWSAIQTHQIDGRSHRDGRFAQVYWIVAKETIDGRVTEVLLEKLESMANLHGDFAQDFDEILSAISEELTR